MARIACLWNSDNNQPPAVQVCFGSKKNQDYCGELDLFGIQFISQTCLDHHTAVNADSNKTFLCESHVYWQMNSITCVV